MKQLFLKVQARAITLENVIKHNRLSRNEYVDDKKQARKDRDEDMFAYASKQIAKLDEDLITLEAQYQQCLRDFDEQRHKVGKNSPRPLHLCRRNLQSPYRIRRVSSS